MKSKRMQQLKQATVLTLLLFATTAAITGIIGLIPSEEAVAASTGVETEVEGWAEEVFSVIPTEEHVSVFAEFQAPLTGTVSSGYGYRNDPFTGVTRYHKGVDVAVSEGTEVRAAASGTVTASEYSGIGGHYIVLSHGNGTESYYGHLQTRTVSVGDRVEQGEIIGLSGKTGRVTGPHLHFQLSYNNRTVDPERYVDLTA